MKNSLREAVKDCRLRGAEFRVLAYLHLEYGSESNRCEIVKLWGISRCLGMDRRTVQRCLRKLEHFGYLKAGDTPEGSPRCYIVK